MIAFTPSQLSTSSYVSLHIRVASQISITIYWDGKEKEKKTIETEPHLLFNNKHPSTSIFPTMSSSF